MASTRPPKQTTDLESRARDSAGTAGELNSTDDDGDESIAGSELQAAQAAKNTPPISQRLQATGWLKKFEKVMASDVTLQPFLEQVLPIIVGHFGALGGLVWLRPHGGHGSWFALRHQMEPIAFGPAETRKHE